MRSERVKTIFLAVAAMVIITSITGCAPDASKIFAKKCAACHAFKGFGGSICPDLTDVSKRRTDAWIIQQIKDPAVNDPNAKMQGFPEMSEKEIQALIDHFKR
ncbi:MAG: cytochrome c [Nitrospirota bacterium]|nr:MAG: cytochrome c [Nitrospirota bacterium]